LTFFFVSTGCDVGDFGFGVRADRRGVGALVFAGVFFAGVLALAGVFLFDGVFFGVFFDGVFFGAFFEGVFFGVASAFAAAPLGFLGFATFFKSLLVALLTFRKRFDLRVLAAMRAQVRSSPPPPAPGAYGGGQYGVI
jgi:hypothetical protein